MKRESPPGGDETTKGGQQLHPVRETTAGNRIVEGTDMLVGPAVSAKVPLTPAWLPEVGPRVTTPGETHTNTSGVQTTDRPHLTEDWRADVTLLDTAAAPIPTVIAGISDPFEALPYGCACGARWAGLKTCHCTACHSTFSTVTAFDKHRVGSHADDRRHCVDPARTGLIDAGRDYPCWAQARRGHGAQARRGDVDELRQKEAGGPGPAD